MLEKQFGALGFARTRFATEREKELMSNDEPCEYAPDHAALLIVHAVVDVSVDEIDQCVDMRWFMDVGRVPIEITDLNDRRIQKQQR